MNLHPLEIVRDAWIAWAVYWFLAAFRVKKMRKREALLLRLGFLAAMALLVVGVDSLGGETFLSHRFMPRVPAVGALGAGVTVAGVAFSIWARYHIGQYWSGSVALREDHRLIRTGPYARIRHPIYTGILVAVAGTALAVGSYRALAVCGIVAVGLTIKAKREESLLAREFGPAFEEHCRQTGFFFPRIS